MRKFLALLTVGASLAGCASAGTLNPNSREIAGSSPNLRPHITGVQESASTLNDRFTVGLVAPAPGYVTLVRVRTQASVEFLGENAAESGPRSLDAGQHTLSLLQVPGYLRANATRAPFLKRDVNGTLMVTDSPYVPGEYIVAVMTSAPITLREARESVGDVDLRGPDDEVLSRVAQAIGAQSGGTWGASALRFGEVRVTY